jgi:hypothetical protein
VPPGPYPPNPLSGLDRPRTHWEYPMLQPTAMIMADRATSQHVLSGRPQAPTISPRPPRPRAEVIRRLTAVTLRRLADRVEPRRVTHATAA